MANVDRPNGFRPHKTLTGEGWNGSFTKMYSSDDLFLGDAVKRAGAGTGGYLDCDRATGTTNGVTLGVVVGWEPNPTNLGALYHIGSATTYAVYVCTDPNMTYLIQGDGAGTVATEADVGLNFDIIVGAGSTDSGLSNFEVDESSAATTIDTPLHCVGLSTDPTNEQGVLNQEFIVMFNMHEFRGALLGQVTGV